MNCHNGDTFLRESINSVINQTHKNWELIFYDNASTDRSKEIISGLKESRIKYFYSKNLLNLYEARQKALELSSGNFICFLDTDDLWESEKLEKQIKFMDKNPNNDLVYSNFFINNGKKKYIKHKSILPEGNITNQLLQNYTIGILTVCLRRSLIEKYKFNIRYNIIGDFDFFLRISCLHKIGCIQEALATYRVHDQNLSKIKIMTYIEELEYWIKKNEEIFKSSYNLWKLKTYIIKLKIKLIIGRIVQW